MNEFLLYYEQDKNAGIFYAGMKRGLLSLKNNDMSQRVIELYKEDEKAMILVYAQWCINEGYDPLKLYKRAYPDQVKNEVLMDILDDTVSKDESEYIPYETLIQMLQVFGNVDLAFVIQEEMEKREAHQQEE